jgi:hypothetical protein
MKLKKNETQTAVNEPMGTVHKKSIDTFFKVLYIIKYPERRKHSPLFGNITQRRKLYV